MKSHRLMLLILTLPALACRPVLAVGWGELLFEPDRTLGEDVILKGRESDDFIPEAPDMDLK